VKSLGKHVEIILSYLFARKKGANLSKQLELYSCDQNFYVSRKIKTKASTRNNVTANHKWEFK